MSYLGEKSPGHRTIQTVIGLALTDTTFRRALLTGSRRRLLQDFPLKSEQIEKIMAIQAGTLEDFAGQLHQLLVEDGQIEPELEPLPRARWRRGERGGRMEGR